jgi:hypothetical protein
MTQACPPYSITPKNQDKRSIINKVTGFCQIDNYSSTRSTTKESQHSHSNFIEQYMVNVTTREITKEMECFKKSNQHAVGKP